MYSLLSHQIDAKRTSHDNIHRFTNDTGISSKVTDTNLKDLSKIQLVNMFKQAKENTFDLAMEYYNSGYDIISNHILDDCQRNLFYYACAFYNKTMIDFFHKKLGLTMVNDNKIDISCESICIKTNTHYTLNHNLGDTPLMYYIKHTPTDKISVLSINAFVNAGVDVNHLNLTKESALLLAVQKSCLNEIIISLINLKAKILINEIEQIYLYLPYAKNVFINENNSDLYLEFYNQKSLKIEYKFGSNDINSIDISTNFKQYRNLVDYFQTHPKQLSSEQITTMFAHAQTGDFSPTSPMYQYESEGYNVITHCDAHNNTLLHYASVFPEINGFTIKNLIEKGIRVDIVNSKNYLALELYMKYTRVINPYVVSLYITKNLVFNSKFDSIGTESIREYSMKNHSSFEFLFTVSDIYSGTTYTLEQTKRFKQPMNYQLLPNIIESFYDHIGDNTLVIHNHIYDTIYNCQYFFSYTIPTITMDNPDMEIQSKNSLQVNLSPIVNRRSLSIEYFNNNSKILSQEKKNIMFKNARNNDFSFALKYNDEKYNILRCFEEDHKLTNLGLEITEITEDVSIDDSNCLRVNIGKPSYVDRDSRSSLDIDRSNSNETAVSKVNTNRLNSGKTLLNYACRHKNYDMIKFLIELGSDVNLVDLNDSLPLADYLSSPFPLNTPISEQIETDKKVLSLFIDNCLLPFPKVDSKTILDNNYLSFYLKTKQMNHQISTILALMDFYDQMIGKEFTFHENIRKKVFYSTFLLTLDSYMDKEIVLKLLVVKYGGVLTNLSTYYHKTLFYIDNIKIVSEPVFCNDPNDNNTTSMSNNINVSVDFIFNNWVNKLSYTSSNVLMTGNIEKSISFFGISIITYFQLFKKYLLTHQLHLSETQQNSMFDAAKIGDFTLALDLDKKGYDIISCTCKESTELFPKSILLYSSLHNRLDIIEYLINNGAVNLLTYSPLGQYITLTTEFNPKVADLLRKSDVDIYITNPIMTYYHYYKYSRQLPPEILIYFKRLGFTFQKVQKMKYHPNVIIHNCTVYNCLSNIFKIAKNHNRLTLNYTLLNELIDLGLDINLIDTNTSDDNVIILILKHMRQLIIKTGVDLFNPDTFKHNIDSLLNLGIEMNSTPYWTSPILIRYLLETNLPIKVKYGYNCDVLLSTKEYHDFIENNLYNILINMKYLITKGANVNALYKGKNIIFYCLDLFKDYFNISHTSLYLCKQICSMLIHEDIDINHTDKNGHNILMYYIQYYDNIDFELVSLFIKRGIDVDVTDSTCKGFTSLLISLYKKSSPEVIYLLVEGTLHSEQKLKFLYNSNGKIIQLLCGTTNKQHQVRRLEKHLVRHNRSLTYSTFITSVRSCESEDYSVVKMFHERYYNTVLVLDPVDHTSVLMYAAKQGFIPMVRWAISLGAKVNAVDRRGMTALMYCCKYSQKYEVIVLLLWHGADVGIKWENRYTAFDMLCKK